MRTFVLAVCLSYFALSLHADALRDRMDAYVRRYADGDFFSGVVRVTKGDRIIYENAFGYADRGWQVPNSLQTRFQIASLSKPMTATAILVLGEERKLSLEDKLSKFLPDFPNGDEITIEELLTHYSGLGDASAQPDYNEWSRFPQTAAALVERAPYLDWTSKTGNGSIYSTADDLLRFHQALQGGSLLKPETLKQSYGFERKDRTVGMFWFHRQRFGHRSVYVNGSSPGFKAHFERFIDDDATVVVLSNLYIAAPSTIAEDLGAMLFDQPVNRDVPRPIHVNGADLKRFAGTFRFGDDYFVKNAVVRRRA